MSEFDRENEDVFQIVHDNPRRRGVIRDVGYIINKDVADRFAAYEAAKKRKNRDLMELITWAILLLCILLWVLVYLFC